MNATERRKAFSVPDLTRIGFAELPSRFEFVPKTFVVYNERIGLYVSDRNGFNVSVHSPESLRSGAGLCFVPGEVHSNMTKAFEMIHGMLHRQGVAIPEDTAGFHDSFLSISSVNERTPITPDTIIHDGKIAIKIATVGVQSIFVLDGFETGLGCVPLGCPVDKSRWAMIFNNFLSTWDSLTKDHGGSEGGG